jgi:hypothetical protein
MKKIGLIILIAIVALGAMGAAYAAWSQTLNITTAVSVAKFEVKFDNVTAPALTPGSKGLSISSSTDYTIALDFSNVKPGDGGTVTYHVLNNSSIPVALTFEYSLDNGGSFTTWNGSTVDIVKSPGDGSVAWLTMANTGFTNGVSLDAKDTTGTLTFSMTGEGNTYAGSAAKTVIVQFVAAQ